MESHLEEKNVGGLCRGLPRAEERAILDKRIFSKRAGRFTFNTINTFSVCGRD